MCFFIIITPWPSRFLCDCKRFFNSFLSFRGRGFSSSLLWFLFISHFTSFFPCFSKLLFKAFSLEWVCIRIFSFFYFIDDVTLLLKFLYTFVAPSPYISSCYFIIDLWVSLPFHDLVFFGEFLPSCERLRLWNSLLTWEDGLHHR